MLTVELNTLHIVKHFITLQATFQSKLLYLHYLDNLVLQIVCNKGYPVAIIYMVHVFHFTLIAAINALALPESVKVVGARRFEGPKINAGMHYDQY